MELAIFTTGGTIDKIYFDAKNTYHIGEPQVGEILRQAGVTLEFSVERVCMKDSLEMLPEDRAELRRRIEASPARHVLITHGTDTMSLTAESLRGIPGKTIVLVGAMQPARFRESDAVFNLGGALMASQLLPEGVWIAMNGRCFEAGKVRKNVEKNIFETLP